MKRLKQILLTCMIGIFLLQSIPIRVFAEEMEEKSFVSGLSYSKVSSEINKFVEEHEETTAGLSMGIYDAENVIYKSNFGYIDKEKQKIVDENSVFDWGSVSKIMIWISAMQLVENGQLDLQEDIRNYLPEGFLKNLTYEKEITMLDLMNHQAGFQETFFVMTANRNEVESLENVLKKHQPKQIYEPGTVTAYSNWGAALAAFVVENISGMEYTKYIHKNIFEPLNMKHTSIDPVFRDNLWVKERREELVCYDDNADPIKGQKMCYVTLFPAGSAVGTLDDFIVFARAITPNKNMKCPLFENEDTLKSMYTATSYFGTSGIANNYHGLFSSHFGVETLGHGGNTYGCSSMLEFDPCTGVGMVVMTNQAQEKIYNHDMYELLFGKLSDSVLSQIKRDIPKEYVSSSRIIKNGPLSIFGTIEMIKFSDEDLQKWWYQEGNHIYAGYGDMFVLGKEVIIPWIFIILSLMAGIYSITTIFIGGCICRPIHKRKQKEDYVYHPSRKWNYILTGINSAIIFDLVIVFLRINEGGITGDMGSINSYMMQFGFIFIAMILLIVSIVCGLIKMKKGDISDTRLEKDKYFFSIFMSLVIVVTIIMFDMYQFWMI